MLPLALLLRSPYDLRACLLSELLEVPVCTVTFYLSVAMRIMWMCSCLGLGDYDACSEVALLVDFFATCCEINRFTSHGTFAGIKILASVARQHQRNNPIYSRGTRYHKCVERSCKMYMYPVLHL